MDVLFIINFCLGKYNSVLLFFQYTSYVSIYTFWDMNFGFVT